MSISANDTTILAMLSRYPNMDSEEVDEHISRIECEENVPVCLAVAGRLSPDDLSVDAKRTYMEFKRWSDNRTSRTRSEQLEARYKNKNTRLGEKLKKMYERGEIPESTLMLYGISGELPDRQYYDRLSAAEKTRLWRERLQERMGRIPDSVRDIAFSWLERSSSRWIKEENNNLNWKKEGF